MSRSPVTILCLASYFKGHDFLRECHRLGARVLLVTREALRDADTMFKRGEMSGSQATVFSLINEVLPYAPFLLRPAHRFFSRMMPAAPKVRWSHEIFPHPRPTRFNEMEYAVPREKGAECVQEIVDTIRKQKICRLAARLDR